MFRVTKKQLNEMERLQRFLDSQTEKKQQLEDERLRKQFKVKSGTWVYDLHELSVILRRSIKKLRLDIRRGKLGASKIGRHYLCTRRDILTYLDNHRHQVKRAPE